MDPEARRFMWSIIHKTTKFGKKSSVVMTTHSMDEAETLCKRMGIMVNGEFVCLGRAWQIKEKYGYGYELDIRIKPLNNLQQNEIIQFLNKNESNFNKDKINSNLTLEKMLKLDSNGFVKYNKKSKINKKEVEEILIKLDKANYIEELSNDRLGKKIFKDIEVNGNIALITLLNWIFFIKNAFKFIKVSFDYFDEIYLVEFIENNFLFKMKKGPKTKSIGFFFGLFEQHKEECFVTEYSIQQTSLEQIFNMFAKEQTNIKTKENNTENKKDENSSDNGILINSEILDKLLI
jgi:ATP-binding cassette subfamily A (ABC1) protein 3